MMYSGAVSDGVYLREKGKLRCLNTGDGFNYSSSKSSNKLFQRDFTADVGLDILNQTEVRKMNDHFIFTSNSEGSLSYTVKRLFDISLLFIVNNIEHVESLLGFPEEMVEKLFLAAEQKQKFMDVSCSVKALQVFSESFGKLVLQSLCLRNRCFLLSERMEEICVFHCLETLDLHGCRLGDNHKFFTHISSEACSRLVTLFLGENCLSDRGLQRLTAPIRVMKRGLERLQHLDLSSNPLTEKGLRYLMCFVNLQELNVSDTDVKLDASLRGFFRNTMTMVLSVTPLQTFTHSQCGTVGWAEEVINKWEMKAAELPDKELKLKTNALRFYGKEKFVQKTTHSLCNNHSNEKKKSTIHFHKLLHLMTTKQEELRTDTHPVTSMKRKCTPDPEEHVHINPQAKRPATLLSLSAEDLDLLNNY